MTLDRPAARNALTREVLLGISDAIKGAEADSARALVLTGSGGFFCAGVDLGVFQEAVAGDVDAVLGELLGHLNTMIAALGNLPIPTLTAVEGGAMGGGLGLALATDICVAGRSARVSSHYAKVGVTPDAGTTYFLARRLGPARANAFMLRSPVVSGEEAAAMGVVDEVVDDGNVLAATLEMAAELTRRPTTVVVGTRALADSALGHSLEEHLEAEGMWVSRCWKDPAVQRYLSGFRSGSSQ